jgi:hypothetical protein
VWAPGPVRTGAENLSPTGIQSPDLLINLPTYSNQQRSSSERDNKGISKGYINLDFRRYVGARSGAVACGTELQAGR